MEPGDPTRAAGRFFALGPPVMSVADRLRLGLPTILVLVGFALAGRFLDGLVIGLGTYTVLFGAIPGRRHRALVMAVAGIGLVTAVCAGILAAGSLPWTLTAFLAAAVLAVVLDTAVRLGPPGPYFFLLMVGGGGVVGAAGLGVADVVPGLALGAVIALVAAVAGPDRDPPDEDGPAAGVCERLTWPHPDAVVFARVTVATVVTFAALTLVGDAHPFWAMLVVVLVLSFPGDRDALLVRTAHRVAGTAVGFLAFWAWTLVGPPTWVAFVAMGVLLWATMSLAPRNYGLACVAITLLALLMTQALLPGEPPARMALDRVADTLVGAVVAVACLLLIRPRRAATETDRSDRR